MGGRKGSNRSVEGIRWNGEMDHMGGKRGSDGTEKGNKREEEEIRREQGGDQIRGRKGSDGRNERIRWVRGDQMGGLLGLRWDNWGFDERAVGDKMERKEMDEEGIDYGNN